MEAAGSDAAEPLPDRSAQPRRDRRKADAATRKADFNGVDILAVRAWPRPTALPSPRGAAKDEAIEAYRAAGN